MMTSRFEQVPSNAKVSGEIFVTAWIDLKQFPGGMMTTSGGGFKGNYGPVPAMTSCLITTSATEMRRWVENGKPVMEIQVADSALEPEVPPQFEIELPDGDSRKVKVWFTEKRADGKWHLSIDVSTTPPPALEWRPIETAPKNSTDFLGWECDSVAVYYRTPDTPDDAAIHMGTACYPTHWMPLPSGPTKEVDHG